VLANGTTVGMIVVAVAMTGIAVAVLRNLSWSRTAVSEWAEASGYTILSFKITNRLKAFSVRFMALCDVTLKDRDGEVHRAVLRCGSALWGTLSSRVTVLWMD